MSELIIKRLEELETKIDRLLGLGLGKYFIDNIELINKKLAPGRIRLYGKRPELVGTDEKAMATYQVSGTHGGVTQIIITDGRRG